MVEKLRNKAAGTGVRVRSSQMCLVVSIAAAVLLLLTRAFKWPLIEQCLDIFLVPAAWLGLFACSVWALQLVIFRRNERGVGGVSLFLCIAAAVAALTLPWTPLWLWANDAWYRGARNDIVREVQKGVLLPNYEYGPDYGPDVICLGPDRSNVSSGGNDIIVQEHGGSHYVFFYTYHGILGDYRGFLYVPVGGDPRLFNDLGEPTTKITHWDGPWYFVVHW